MSETSATPDLTAERLRADVERVLGEPAGSVGEDDNLLDLGMDSIRLMSLVETWRKAGVETDFMTLAEEPSVRAWSRLLLND
ncbi:phosphopantetheine-binding protein [Streptomonospora nanhaiensis]|uniref:Aryl carrier-like protein n=1 Tax=Streptomonospora nanhaiensis TaxID=1323731 RepID=A0A853BH30_9ACTN|nr:phosphopantetheine-binding protein [Streptomonospora nanhaiensis]MBV2363774.1 acyl carrier protein [Streptomonospora nanhaiensis]MBX9388539.1 acyl carrier protein [Streptomonospora nanhaiensis]NYI93922.1 aryl carrier-like protein [Streptomonospora nanhaiensis]